MIDRSRLTREEREELRLALLDRKQHLDYRVTMQPGTESARDARWQLFVVESLLAELAG